MTYDIQKSIDLFSMRFSHPGLYWIICPIQEQLVCWESSKHQFCQLENFSITLEQNRVAWLGVGSLYWLIVIDIQRNRFNNQVVHELFADCIDKDCSVLHLFTPKLLYAQSNSHFLKVRYSIAFSLFRILGVYGGYIKGWTFQAEIFARKGLWPRPCKCLECCPLDGILHIWYFGY